MVSAWGTGKTMCALHKGHLLNQCYKNNLGLIVRSKFTDLRDSTMKDFTRYTGLHVPQGTKEVSISNGSTTLFRHAKELSGLQNVNLGWFYIEQAEEFPTDTQFTLLRGRLRRELEWDENVEANTPLLKDLKENPLRQGMVIANANGRNWIWKKWIKSPQDGYMCVQATSFDNENNVPADFIKDLKRMKIDSPSKYAQYVMNDHSEIDIAASYYARFMSELRRAGQICSVPHDPNGRVQTSWDLGFDCTSIWFFQTVGLEVHLIDYFESTGKPISFYADMLDARKMKYKYNYGTFHMPHDAKKREMVAGITLSHAIRNMGYDVITHEREMNVDAGINRVMGVLPRCWFDEEKCELGIEALDHYRREYNEELKIYMEKPLHDWASHPADSFRYMTKGLTVATKGNISIDTWRELKLKYA